MQLLSQKNTNKLSFFQPYDKQAQFYAAGKEIKARLFLGGNRSGKTTSGIYEGAFHLTGQYPSWWKGRRFDGPINMWAASDTSRSTRDILVKGYLGGTQESELGQGTIPLDNIVIETIRRERSFGVEEVKVKHISGGYSTLGFRSYDQERRKFQGTQLHFIHLDEEPPHDIYTECVARTTKGTGANSFSGGCIILTMTPLKGMTEVCKHFLQENTPKGHFVIQASVFDNPHIDKEDLESVIASYAPHELEARVKGVPSLGSGKVYPVMESEILVKPFGIDGHMLRAFAIDFGWSVPTAVVWGAYDKNNDVWYLYDCYYEKEKHYLEHAAAIRAKGSWIKGVADPAGSQGSEKTVNGKGLIELYADTGLSLKKANNAIEPGIQEMFARMKTGRLKVFDNAQMIPWIEEFRNYYRKDGKIAQKQDDHLMDASRYLIMSGKDVATSPGNSAGDWFAKIVEPYNFWSV